MAALRGLTLQRCLVRSRNAFTAFQKLQNVQTQQMSTSHLQTSVDDKSGVAVMKMCRPPVNSLNLEYLTEISIALEKLENEKCKGLILTTGVPKIFCAGLDIMEMYQPNTDRLQMFWRTLQDVWLRLYTLKMPSIAAINGHSPAGGCLLSLCCDYRIMAPNYSIGLNETKLGIVAPFWFKDTLIQTIKPREVERALQLGLMYNTEEALNIGMIDKVVASEDIMSAAEEEMKQWLAIPALARQLTKEMLRKPLTDKLRMCREDDIAHFRDFITKDSIQKALGMYIEMLKQRKK